MQKVLKNTTQKYKHLKTKTNKMETKMYNETKSMLRCAFRELVRNFENAKGYAEGKDDECVINMIASVYNEDEMDILPSEKFYILKGIEAIQDTYAREFGFDIDSDDIYDAISDVIVSIEEEGSIDEEEGETLYAGYTNYDQAIRNCM